MTRVPRKAAWEYCLYISDNNYGYYRKDGTKVTMPFGMAVNRTSGDAGSLKIKISKQLLTNAPVIRYTITTFTSPIKSNSDTLYQGGSSAVDVFPGSLETFGGEINGYGQITPAGATLTTEYTIYYLYDGINPIVEYAPNGSILARYIYAGGLHIAKIAGADTMWYHCDALGSPRKMTNESGAVTWTGAYQPFGEMITGSGNVHGFTPLESIRLLTGQAGKELDAETGLNYFCQRYYDSQIGRFMSLDTWTNLPDDERLLSYERYLSWNNYRLNYTPQIKRNSVRYALARKNLVFAYDSLPNEIISVFSLSGSAVLSDSIIFTAQNNVKKFFGFRYYVISEKYQNQLNGYRYCWNNPAKYTDPTGHLAPLTTHLLGGLAWFLYTESLCGFKHIIYAYEFWRDWLSNQLKMDTVYYVDPKSGISPMLQ